MRAAKAQENRWRSVTVKDKISRFILWLTVRSAGDARPVVSWSRVIVPCRIEGNISKCGEVFSMCPAMCHLYTTKLLNERNLTFCAVMS